MMFAAIFSFTLTLLIVRGYSAGSAMQTPEPGEIIRELLAKKQALQMELRQRAAMGSSMYYGSRLAISLLTRRGAARVALAAGPGLLVIRTFGHIPETVRVLFHHRLLDFFNLNRFFFNKNGISRAIKIARFKCII